MYLCQLSDDKVLDSHGEHVTAFSEACMKEIESLMFAELFRIVGRKWESNTVCIYGTRWVNAVKEDRAQSVLKSRLDVPNLRDKHAAGTPTRAYIIYKVGQRVALAIVAMCTQGTTFTRDIAQAYTQSSSRLEREVSHRSSAEINLPNNNVLLTLKPLCDSPESGLHWVLTHRDYYNTHLSMTATVVEPSNLYCWRPSGGLPQVITVQVDDSSGTGKTQFLRKTGVGLDDLQEYTVRVGKLYSQVTCAHSIDRP